MNRLFWPAFAALACLPAPVIGEPLLSFGPDIPLFVTAAASIRRDDNVLLSPRDKSSDTICVLAPGLDFHSEGGGASAAITASDQFVRYGSNTSLNDDLPDIEGSFAYKDSQSRVTAAASYQGEDQSVLTSRNSDQTVRHSLAAASASGEWGVTARTRVGAGASFERTIYPEAGFVDSDVWSFPVDLYYAVTPKVDASLGCEYVRTAMDTGAGDSDSRFFNVGARGDFTPKLSGQVRIGVTELQPLHAAADRQPGVETSLNYLYTPRTTFVLTVDNGFGSSPVGSSQEALSASLGGNFQLGQAWAAAACASFSSTKYLVAPGRTDRFAAGNIGLTYAWTADTAFHVAYYFRRNASTLALAGFDDNVLDLTASSRF